MRILVISNNPTRPSFRQRIGLYLPFLRENGIDAEIAKLPSGAWARRRLFARAGDYDSVLLHKKKLNAFDAFWLRRCARTIIYDFDDAVMYSPSRPDRASWSHSIPFRRTVRLADTVIAGNPYLADHARKFNENVCILPTGLDIEPYSRPLERRPDGKIRLVWIGSSSTLKYLAAVKPALEELGLQRANAILRIICDEFFDLENMGVEKKRWGQNSQFEDLGRCDIGLAPLPDDSFTRGKCGFKILQYFAASLPAVASPVGVNAEFVQPGCTGFHATTHAEWVQLLSKLIDDSDLRVRLGANARKFAQDFDQTAIAPRLLDLLRSVGTRKT